jgi:hypothetical protein
VSLPPGIRRQHRYALAAARSLRSQTYELFLAAWRSGIDKAAASDVHNAAVALCESLERLPRIAAKPKPDPRTLAAGGGR